MESNKCIRLLSLWYNTRLIRTEVRNFSFYSLQLLSKNSLVKDHCRWPVAFAICYHFSLFAFVVNTIGLQDRLCNNLSVDSTRPIDLRSCIAPTLIFHLWILNFPQIKVLLKGEILSSMNAKRTKNLHRRISENSQMKD